MRRRRCGERRWRPGLPLDLALFLSLALALPRASLLDRPTAWVRCATLFGVPEAEAEAEVDGSWSTRGPTPPAPRVDPGARATGAMGTPSSTAAFALANSERRAADAENTFTVTPPMLTVDMAPAPRSGSPLTRGGVRPAGPASA